LVPQAPAAVESKSGTSVIKAAPPKETARITVKPSLPTSSPARPGSGTTPVVAAAAGAAAAVAAVKATEAKPASKPAAAVQPSNVVQYREESEGSTLITTIAAGVLAVITWGTAALLCYYSLTS
jgi:hypothetical protein